VKHPDRLIGIALTGSVIAAAGSVVILWFAGRSADSDWPIEAAFDHPTLLVAGEALGAIAWAAAAASVAAVGLRHGGSSVLVALGVACLVVSIPGAAFVFGLDLAYASRVQDGVLQAIFFGQRWNWWSAVGWLLFAFGGSLGLLAIGIGLARGSRALRYPGIALAASLVAAYLFTPAAILLATSLCWLAVVVARPGSHPIGGTPQAAR
jgi:hypothetical protein